MISLTLAAAAAVLLPVVWRLWGSEETTIAHQRTLAEMELDWRCEEGHDFRGKGHTFGPDGLTSPRTCWKCGEPAYPVATYVCPVHGAYEVTVRFTIGDDGRPRVAQVRWAGRGWVTEEEGLRCPRCERRLEYSDDPFIGRNRNPKRGD